jgi:RNA polymerase sigma factor (sigma-70 family)
VREARAASIVAEPADPTPSPLDQLSAREVMAVFDEELGRLPAACRDALVLCYLEGRTQDEAAAQLDVSKSTLRRNLERGRGLLGRRLARRGRYVLTVRATRDGRTASSRLRVRLR